MVVSCGAWVHACDGPSSHCGKQAKTISTVDLITSFLKVDAGFAAAVKKQDVAGSAGAAAKAVAVGATATGGGACWCGHAGCGACLCWWCMSVC